MTIFEFAIARRFNQLVVESDSRTLNYHEDQLTMLLVPIIERYEERETREATKPRIGSPRGEVARASHS